MKSFLRQKAVFLCFALSLGQGLFAQDLSEVKDKITQVVDLLMLQIELNLAAGNGSPDIIEIGEGVFDLSVLDQDLTYAPLPEPKVTQEERYPITIVGAGVGKTIFEAGKGVRKFWLSSAQLKDDMGVIITVKGITFRNGGGSSSDPAGLAIGTKLGTIEVRDCEFISTNGSHGSSLYARSGAKFGGGVINVISCRFDSLRSSVTLSSSRASAFVKDCKFTNFRDCPALDISNNFGGSFILKCKFINNRTYREAPLNAHVFPNGTVEVVNCTFENNFGSISGALRVAGRESTVNISRNTFTANSGGTGSGAAVITMDGSGKIIADANLFQENHNNTQGGGLSMISAGNKKAGAGDNKAFIGVYNNIFSKNRTAGDGGGLYVETQEGNVEIINNTLVENSTLAYPNCTTGAGLCVKTCANEASALIYNNIFWNNWCKSKAGIDLRIDNDPDYSFPAILLQPDGIGASVVVSNNISRNTSSTISNAVTVRNNIIADPLLDSKFKLQAKSPAIDAGTKYGHGRLGGGEDFAGKDRVIDGNGDGQPVVDLGAIEYKQK